LEKAVKRNFNSNSKDTSRTRIHNDEFDRVQIIRNILIIWKHSPFFALASESGTVGFEEFKLLIKNLKICITEFPENIRKDALVVLCCLFDSSVATQWLFGPSFNENMADAPPEDCIKNYWTVYCSHMTSLCKDVIQISSSDSPHKQGILAALGILIEHILHCQQRLFGICYQIVKQGKTIQEIHLTHAAVEIALLTMLLSQDVSISKLAVACISKFIRAVKSVNNQDLDNPFSSFDNLEVYESICSHFTPTYWALAMSNKMHQKNIRDIIRNFRAFSGGLIGTYEEMMRRWKFFYSSVLPATVRNGSTASSISSLSELPDEENSKKKSKKMNLGIKSHGEIHKGSNLVTPDLYNVIGFLLAMANLVYSSCNCLGDLDREKSFSSVFNMNRIGNEMLSRDILLLDSDHGVDWQEAIQQINNIQSKIGDVISSFVEEVIELLNSDFINIREILKEILNFELSGEFAGNFMLK
jgi:hypothetical protein